MAKKKSVGAAPFQVNDGEVLELEDVLQSPTYPKCRRVVACNVGVPPGKNPCLKPHWPPLDWESHDCPCDDSDEAIRDWLHFVAGPAGLLSFWSAIRSDFECAFIVRDAWRLVEHLRSLERTSISYRKPQKRYTADEAKAELLEIREQLFPTSPLKLRRKPRRGRKPDPDYNPAMDQNLCTHWKAAKGQGQSRTGFCRERGLKLLDLIAAQQRVKYRRIRDAE